MSKRPLTDAERDSHKVTMGLHVGTANRLISEENWNGALLALKLALPHANAVGHKETKKTVFRALNVVRAKVRASVNHASA